MLLISIPFILNILANISLIKLDNVILDYISILYLFIISVPLVLITSSKLLIVYKSY